MIFYSSISLFYIFYFLRKTKYRIINIVNVYLYLVLHEELFFLGLCNNISCTVFNNGIRTLLTGEILEFQSQAINSQIYG